MSMNDTPIRLVSYLAQLEAMAVQARVSLLHAFIKAGVPSSTYYRTINGAELRYETATKVASFLRRIIKKGGAEHDAGGRTTTSNGQPAVVQ
jgi:predicted transcriptional regulator